MTNSNGSVVRLEIHSSFDMLDFVQLFAPHITVDQLEKTRHARSQADIDRLFLDADLPVRGGCSERMTNAA